MKRIYCEIENQLQRQIKQVRIKQVRERKKFLVDISLEATFSATFSSSFSTFSSSSMANALLMVNFFYYVSTYRMRRNK